MKKNNNIKVLALISSFVLTTNLAMAEAISVDLGDAQTSIADAGTAMIGIAVVMLGIGLVYSFLKSK